MQPGQADKGDAYTSPNYPFNNHVCGFFVGKETTFKQFARGYDMQRTSNRPSLHLSQTQTQTKRTTRLLKTNTLPDITIPSQVFYNENISSNGKILLAVLNHLTNNGIKYCDLTNKTLSKILGVTPATITKLISKLNRAQLIRTKYVTDFNGQRIRQIFLNTIEEVE